MLDLKLAGMVGVQRAEIAALSKDDGTAVVLQVHVGFTSFAEASIALSVLAGAATAAAGLNGDDSAPPKAAKTLASAFTKPPAPSSPSPSAVAKPLAAAAAAPPAQSAAATAATAAVAKAKAAVGTAGPKQTSIPGSEKPKAATPAKAKPAAPTPPPADEAESDAPLADDELTEVQASAAAALANAANLKDVMLYFFEVYGGPETNFDPSGVSAETICADVEAIRAHVPAIERVYLTGSLAARVSNATAALLAQRGS